LTGIAGLLTVTYFLRRSPDMEKIKVILNRESNTLDVWFDNPEKEFICEETGDEIVLKKDKNNKVIGFEKLNLLVDKNANISVEVTAT
jgi:uncharacterized protein YuzE